MKKEMFMASGHSLGGNQENHITLYSGQDLNSVCYEKPAGVLFPKVWHSFPQIFYVVISL